MSAPPQPANAETLNKIDWDLRSNPIREYEVLQSGTTGVAFKIPKRFDPMFGTKRVGYMHYLHVYYENQSNVDFEPTKFITWDRIFEDYLNDVRWHNAISNPRHHYYDDYEPVRQNIDMLGIIARSEPPMCNAPDAVKERMLKSLAEQAASTLKWHSIWRGITNFVTGQWSTSGDVAKHRFGTYGEEHLGAAKLYAKLVENQGKIILDPISWVQGKFRHPNWNLPPVEESPFSQKDMVVAMYIENREDKVGMEDPGNRLKADGLLLARQAVTSKPGHVRNMPLGDSRHAIDLGHTIIDNLKRINYGMNDRSLDSRANQRQELEAAEYFIELSTAYQTLLAGVAQQDIGELGSPVFVEAQQAMGKLSYLVLLQAEKAYLKDKDPDANKRLQELMEAKRNLPESFQHVGGDTNPKDLVKKIEKAMEYAAEYQGLRAQRQPTKQKGIQLSPEASSRVEASLAKMHGSIDGYSARINGIGGSALQDQQLDALLHREIAEINTLNQERASQPIQREASNSVAMSY